MDDEITVIICEKTALAKGDKLVSARYVAQGSCDGVLARITDGTSLFIPLASIVMVQHGMPNT